MELECTKCGYKWDYGGSLNLATCPNCGYKVKVEKDGDTDG